MFKVFMLLVFMAGLNGCGNEYKNEALDKRFVFETFKYGNREGRYIALYDKGEITVIDRSENYDHELVRRPNFLDENQIAYTWDSNIFIYNIKERKKERKIRLFNKYMLGYGFINNHELVAAGWRKEKDAEYTVLIKYNLETESQETIYKWITKDYVSGVFSLSEDKKYVYMISSEKKSSPINFIEYSVETGKVREFQMEQGAAAVVAMNENELVTSILGDLTVYNKKTNKYKTVQESGVVLGPFAKYSKNEVAYRTDDEDWAIINIETGKKRNFRKIYGVPEKGYILYDIDFYFPETDHN